MAAYEYYRLYISEFRRNGSASQYLSLAEFGLYDSELRRLTDIMDYTPSAYTEDSSSPIANAFDLNPNTIWHSSSSAKSGWVQVHFSEPAEVSYYGIMPRILSGYADYLYSWTLQGSSDGETWIDLDSHSGMSDGWTQGMMRCFEIGGGAK